MAKQGLSVTLSLKRIDSESSKGAQLIRVQGDDAEHACYVKLK